MSVTLKGWGVEKLGPRWLDHTLVRYLGSERLYKQNKTIII